MEEANIVLRLLDRGFFKDALVGMYQFDLSYIYFMEQHTLFHQWIALQNPLSQEFNEVTAYLKVSISIAWQEDEQIQINDDTEKESLDAISIMMPPSLKPQYWQLKIKFFKGEKLPVMDKPLFGSGEGGTDAYVKCKFMGRELRTKVQVMKKGELFWNEGF